MPLRRMGRTRQSSTPRLRAPHPATSRRPGPRWSRSRRPITSRPPRDWIQISVTSLPGLAAVVALIFTWVSVNATNNQLLIAEQGQITDRYSAAITNLGSPSIDMRLGGIYALQRIMQDSSRDQPTVVAVLCAFVRDHAKLAVVSSARLAKSPHASSPPIRPPTDIQAALTVVGTRDPAYDGPTTVDFSDTDLVGANLSSAQFEDANFYSTNLAGANLDGTFLYGADLSNANLVGANLINVNLEYGKLVRADLSSASLSFADLNGAALVNANLYGAFLRRANLDGAILDNANLTHASSRARTSAAP